MATTKPIKYIIHPHEAPVRRVGGPEALARGGNPKDQGFNRSYVSWDVNGSTDISLGVWTMKPGEIHPLHHHPDGAEIYYVISGTAKFVVGDEEVEGTPGTSMYIPRNCKHRIEVDGDEPLVFIWAYDVTRIDGQGGPGMVWDE